MLDDMVGPEAAKKPKELALNKDPIPTGTFRAYDNNDDMDDLDFGSKKQSFNPSGN